MSTRHSIPLAVAMIDIDHFKKTNDTYGHQAGDFILRTLSESIRQNIRLSDFIVRYGGEEFIVAAPGASTMDCHKFMERIRTQVAALNVQYGSYDLKLTFSGGIAGFPSGSIRDVHALIQVADEALYKAKEQGRNTLVIAS
jgi:diguanylate cyclase (GGDEF)-like protein